MSVRDVVDSASPSVCALRSTHRSPSSRTAREQRARFGFFALDDLHPVDGDQIRERVRDPLERRVERLGGQQLVVHLGEPPRTGVCGAELERLVDARRAFAREALHQKEEWE